MIEVVVVLSLVVYRVTRFLIDDSLIDEPRAWLMRRVMKGRIRSVTYADPLPAWREKVADLMECPYCLSVWVSAGAVGLACWTWSVPQPFWTWLAVCGLSVAVYVKIED